VSSASASLRPQHTLQEYLPQESLLAVRLAVEAASMDDLRQRLAAALPQNSAVTRRRYVESITRWFLRDGCRGFAPTVWARFQNLELQLALHRYLFLTTQPIMAAGVVSVLSRLADGIVVPTEYVGTSMAKLLGHELSAQTQKRLLANLRKLGFLERTAAGDRVVAPPFPRSALLLALPAGPDRRALDLLDLLDEKSLPDSEEDAAILLRRALRQRLIELAPSGGQRRVLIVKSAGLLVRYDLGLKEFFDWFCGDHGLAVVLIEATPDRLSLPAGIECRPRALADYFHRPDLALEWLEQQARPHLKVALDAWLQEQHQLDTAQFRARHGDKKLGQEIVASRLAEGQLKAKYKERFTHICQQITKLGGYTGIAFVVDEFRSWQDRHVEHSAVAGEDEDVLETLAHILPGEGVNVITIIASQGDVPQKLSGGGKGDRFIPLLLLGDKNKNDFGEIVAFRTVEHLPGASTVIRDYFNECREKYRFLKQANISFEQFAAIFPFQPRVFEILRRITQSAESHNLPTARSAIRMAWQAISDGKLLDEQRLVVVADLIQSDEMRKGLNSELFRDKSQNLHAAIEQLAELELAPEERDQARRILETLFLQAISVPENIRDGLTAQELAEAAWLSDLAVGATGQAEHLLEHGLPARYVLPKTIAASTRRVHNVSYSGEVIVADRWREEWAKAIDQPDVHFRVVYLVADGTAKDSAVLKALADPRIVVCHPKSLSPDTREAVADLLAAEKMRRDHAQSPSLRAYAEEKRADAIKAVLTA